MRRREFLAASGLAFSPLGRRALEAQTPVGAQAFESVGSRVRITGMKVFGASLTPDSDRPYVFVKLETSAGVVGWGEATLEGKAGAVMACIDDFREFVIGADPVQVEHHWQSLYIHSYYRAGPVIGSAISGINQAMWDLRGKIFALPVYQLLGGPIDPRGVRGYYQATGATTRDELLRIRAEAEHGGITCLKSGLPDYYEWISPRAKIESAVSYLQMLRETLGPNIDIAVDFHAKTSPSVATIICKEVEPLKLLWVEEPCPPENVQAMAKISRRTTTPIATGERLITSFGCRELIELGAVDILQPDINHVGGISALWKVAAMADASGISIAPHTCEGPVAGLATINLDAAMPNFLVQEICSGVEPMMKEKAWEEWLGFPAMRMVNGRLPLSDKPGLGFELTEESLKKYPFGGTRPMVRVFHDDGSVAEW
jgi:galactonate dehydratase